MASSDPNEVTPRERDGSQGRRPVAGPRIGRFRITATRVMLSVAVIGPIAFLGYAITVRDPTQIPLLVAGLAVLGLVFVALATIGAISTFRAAADGRGGRSFVLAMLGGLAGIVAFGCFGGAIILALAYRTGP
jgi:hypothetical protein